MPNNSRCHISLTLSHISSFVSVSKHECLRSSIYEKWTKFKSRYDTSHVINLPTMYADQGCVCFCFSKQYKSINHTYYVHIGDDIPNSIDFLFHFNFNIVKHSWSDQYKPAIPIENSILESGIRKLVRSCCCFCFFVDDVPFGFYFAQQIHHSVW